MGSSKTSFQIDDVAEYNFEEAGNAPNLITGKRRLGFDSGGVGMGRNYHLYGHTVRPVR